jgi:hypothetical protein
MKLSDVTATAAVGCLLAVVSVHAHHSFAAEFDAERPVQLKGTLTKLEWVNPHGWLYMDVADASGKVTNWSVEAGAPNALIRRGLRVDDFPIGAQIVVEGYRAKDGTPTANGMTVRFADGRNFFMGSAGTGGPELKKGGASR